MSEEEETNPNSGKFDTFILYATIFCGFIVGRFFGFVGIGAFAIGWFVFYKTKESLGRFLAVCAGAVAGLAAYGLAAIAIFG